MSSKGDVGFVAIKSSASVHVAIGTDLLRDAVLEKENIFFVTS